MIDFPNNKIQNKVANYQQTTERKTRCKFNKHFRDKTREKYTN